MSEHDTHQDANIAVWQATVSASETLLVPPGFLTAMCTEGNEDVSGAKMLFLAKGNAQRGRLSALAEMLSDNAQAQQIVKTAIDAMALLP